MAFLSSYTPTFNTLALCAGAGMLEVGLSAGLEYLGIPARVLAYVEREASAAATLLARMEEQALERAPVWCGDLAEFEASRFRGQVDCVAAGFPCQPHSAAGKRQGLADERWIWPSITGILRACEPPFAFFENVPGLVSTGGLERVLFDLALLGFNAQWCHIRASAVGAAHQRERIFILAHRDGCRLKRTRLYVGPGRPDGAEALAGGVEPGLGEPASLGRGQGEQRRGSECDGVEADTERAGEPVAHPMRQRRQQDPRGAYGNEGQDAGWPEVNDYEPASESAGLADPDGDGLGAVWKRVTEGPHPQPHGGDLAVAIEPGRQGRGHPGPAWRGVFESCDADIPIFAPGPSDSEWPALLDELPHLTPAIESGFCVLVDGMALVVDANRADALRIAGNGVVPLQAASAAVLLFQRAGVIE